jgi:hypothetical protein
VDDIALILVSLPDPVPSGGQFYQALLGTFSQAPKSMIRLCQGKTELSLHLLEEVPEALP